MDRGLSAARELNQATATKENQEVMRVFNWYKKQMESGKEAKELIPPFRKRVQSDIEEDDEKLGSVLAPETKSISARTKKLKDKIGLVDTEADPPVDDTIVDLDLAEVFKAYRVVMDQQEIKDKNAEDLVIFNETRAFQEIIE
ncbi:MAG: hypothetical protein Q9204_001781 [Flavoplaca sp. TL-2023a]